MQESQSVTWPSIKDSCHYVLHHIRSSITRCHINQMFKEGKRLNRPFQNRMNINNPAFSKVSIDIKYMPCSTKLYKYTLVLLCKVTMIALPIKQHKQLMAVQPLWESILNIWLTYSYYFYQDPVFMSNIAQYFFSSLELRFLVSVTSYKSHLAEHGIKNLINIFYERAFMIGITFLD